MATLPSNQQAHRDNLLGVCAAMGEVAGIDPLIFRIAFVLAMLGLSFEMTTMAYAVGGLMVFLARR